jgi:AraC family transcriptional regulator
MKPRVEISNAKKLVGKRLVMNFENYKVEQLWKSFIPRRKEITNQLTNNLISMAIYKPNHFEEFNQTNQFEKWATVEVNDFNNVPEGMETFTLESGLYAVFDYKGLHTDYSIYQYIFSTWLPNLPYKLENRPHFEILGDKYRNNDCNSEEEIWIPIQIKHS